MEFAKRFKMEEVWTPELMIKAPQYKGKTMFDVLFANGAVINTRLMSCNLALTMMNPNILVSTLRRAIRRVRFLWCGHDSLDLASFKPIMMPVVCAGQLLVAKNTLAFP